MATETSPSLGKTMVVAGSVPLAIQDIMNTVATEAWNLPWFSPHLSASIMIVAIAAAGLVVHRDQRKKENAEAEKVNGESVSGGAA